jgi:membrane-bound serine protease (ClpP class)
MSDFTIVLGAVLVVVGILILLLDVAHPGLFLLIPSAVIIAIGTIFLVAPDVFYANPLAAALVVLAAGCGGAVIAIPLYQKLAPRHAPIASTVDTLTGMTAKVTVRVEPGTMKGKVRVRGEIWSATSDEPIPEGANVKVLGGEGIVLKVQTLSGPGDN